MMSNDLVTDLIIDMVLNKATKEELSRAIKYSQIVMHAECMHEALGIPELTRKYLTFELKED